MNWTELKNSIFDKTCGLGTRMDKMTALLVIRKDDEINPNPNWVQHPGGRGYRN